jgi:deoxycytidylate deaminase
MNHKKHHLIARCYDKRGRLISTGENEYRKSHPLFKHFAIQAGESEEKIYKHAEFSAIITAGKKIVDTINVERFHKNGQSANAEPCKTCKLMLSAFGVRRVIYTHEDGLKELYVND